MHNIFVLFLFNVVFVFSLQPTSSQQRSDSLAGKTDLKCLALCEGIYTNWLIILLIFSLCVVVTSKELRRSREVWVCPNMDHVCTRFFFVYDSATWFNIGSDTAFDTRQSQCKKEINHAIQHISMFRKRKAWQFQFVFCINFYSQSHSCVLYTRSLCLSK